MKHRLRPADVALPKGIFQFIGVFDKAEAEAAAALIVLALQVHSPDEWSSVTGHQVADLLRGRHEALKGSLGNPFWFPKPRLLVEAGLLTEEASDDGTQRWSPTDEFVERLSGSQYDLRADLS